MPWRLAVFQHPGGQTLTTKLHLREMLTYGDWPYLYTSCFCGNGEMPSRAKLN